MDELIYAVIRRIRKGKIASYGQIAAVAGIPRGARLVGWALRRLPVGLDVPWHRVVNQRKEISIIHPCVTGDRQAELLRSEGLQVIKTNEGVLVVEGEWANLSI